MPPKNSANLVTPMQKRANFVRLLPKGLFCLFIWPSSLTILLTILTFVVDKFFENPSKVESVFEDWPAEYEKDPEKSVLQLINFLLHVCYEIIRLLLLLCIIFVY